MFDREILMQILLKFKKGELDISEAITEIERVIPNDNQA